MSLLQLYYCQFCWAWNSWRKYIVPDFFLKWIVVWFWFGLFLFCFFLIKDIKCIFCDFSKEVKERFTRWKVLKSFYKSHIHWEIYVSLVNFCKSCSLSSNSVGEKKSSFNANILNNNQSINIIFYSFVDKTKNSNLYYFPL